MDVFIARQPIFNSNHKIFGYELLFRDGFENSFPDVDGDDATSTLMSNIFFPFDFIEILGGKSGLINFTEKLLVQNVPLLLPKEHFIIEVLEDIEPSREVIAALSQLKKKGFTVALDDFAYHKKYEPMIDLCKIIKFDVMATPLDGLADIVAQIKSTRDIVLLAEKIETYNEFEQAREMGFDLFQGFFFARPQVLSAKAISAQQATKLRLINEVAKTDLDLKNIMALIKNDASVTFKLLKFVNSAYFSRPNSIDTVKDAITYIGTDELRKFISIVAISDLSESKPGELVRTSIIRARMCEGCGTLLNTGFSTDELFSLGLFSLMDAMLDCDMEDVLHHILFSEKMRNALLGQDKTFNLILNIVQGFERGEWNHEIFQAMSGTPIEPKLSSQYLDSIKMATAFL